nr:RNA-dependent RNA polymerase [Cypovirus 4]
MFRYDSVKWNTFDTISAYIIDSYENTFAFNKFGKLPENSYWKNDFKPISYRELLDTNFRSENIIGTISECRLRDFQFIFKPRPFNRDFYPENANKTDFKPDRPYNYLASFSLKSYYAQVPKSNGSEESDFEHKLFVQITALIELYQFQTKCGDIWRVISSILWELDDYYNTQNHIVRHILYHILEPYTSAPFYQTHNSFKFYLEDHDVISILTCMIYILGYIGVDIIAGVLHTSTAVCAWNNYVFYSDDSIFDTYLKHKSDLTSWFEPKIASLGVQRVPRFSLYGELIEAGVVDCSQDKIFAKLHKDTLDDYPETSVARCLRRLVLDCTTKEDTIRALLLCRTVSNTRLYLATLLELGKEAGSGARTEGQLVIPPVPTKITISRNAIVELKFPQSVQDFPKMLAYLRNFIPQVLAAIKKVNFNQKFIDMLTTRSSGQKVRNADYSKLVNQASQVRVVNAAVTADKFAHESSIQDIAIRVTRAGVRFQIGRRARQIFITSNEEFALNVPIYVILEAFTSISPYAHLGKQQGGVTDFATALATTTMEGILHSYSDIAGMDASYQRSLQLTLGAFLLEVASQTDQYSYASFLTKREPVKDLEFDTEVEMLVPALHACVGETIRRRIAPIAFDSPIFGRQTMENQAFGSGLASTSVNHTVTIIADVRGNDYAVGNTERIGLNVLGDDLSTRFYARRGNELALLEQDAENMNKLGFKLETGASFLTTELLQQRALLGSYVPYPDRISTITTERPNFKSMPKERCDEDFQLFSDLANRAIDVDRLSNFTFVKAAFTSRRLTVSATPANIKKLQSVKPDTYGHACKIKILPIIERETVRRGRTEKKMQKVQITLPLSWLVLHGGGELPSPALQRKDLTFTSPKSLYGPRGHYCNRIIFDLCQDQMELDHELLKAYNFDVGHALAQVNMVGFRQLGRRKRIDRKEIKNMSHSLLTHGDSTAIEESEKAYRQLLKVNIKVPENHVYAYQTENKIYEALMAPEVNKFEDVLIPDTFVSLLTRKRSPISDVNMKAHRYTINKIPDEPRMELLYPFLGECAVQPNASKYSTSWMLMQMFGFMTSEKVERMSTLSVITGKYGLFKVGDSQFKEAMRIYRQSPDYLDVFFDAMNLSPSAREIYRNALDYHRNPRETVYEYVVTNRQLMIINPDFGSIRDFISSPDELRALEQKHGPRFSKLVSFLYILSSAQEYAGERLTCTLWDKDLEPENSKRQFEIIHNDGVEEVS